MCLLFYRAVERSELLIPPFIPIDGGGKTINASKSFIFFNLLMWFLQICKKKKNYIRTKKKKKNYLKHLSENTVHSTWMTSGETDQ